MTFRRRTSHLIWNVQSSTGLSIFSAGVLLLLFTWLPHSVADTPRPHRDGFATLQVLGAYPEVIFCVLRVSGGPGSELLAIDPTGKAHIRWRVSSDAQTWDVLKIEDEMYTLEGTRLQKRSPQDGTVLKEIEVSSLQTPVSRKRPWTDLENKRTALQRKRASSGRKNSNEVNQQIKDLTVDITAAQEEWAMQERLAGKLSGALDEKGKVNQVFFLRQSGEPLELARKRLRSTTGGWEVLFLERMKFDTETIRLLTSSALTTKEYETLRQRRNLSTYPFMLHVLNEKEFKTMKVDAKKTDIVLLCSDPGKRKTLWRLDIPVLIKKISQ